MQKGERIMIHTGSSSYGQAAIALALDFDSTVFTTVANQEQRAFIKCRFPQVSAMCNIVTETTFERCPTSNTHMHMHITPDLMLNLISLSGGGLFKCWESILDLTLVLL
jgi:hypothetical protein